MPTPPKWLHLSSPLLALGLAGLWDAVPGGGDAITVVPSEQKCPPACPWHHASVSFLQALRKHQCSNLGV